MDAINLWLRLIFTDDLSVLLIVGTLLLAVAEIGHRLGLRLHRSQDEPRMKQVDAVQSAVLALMGLLLAFTFSMAAQRYDLRNRLVVDEANAIGTAFQRADFLPEANRADAKNLLRHYLTVRLQREQAAASPAKLAEYEATLAKIQSQLWQSAVELTRANPSSMMTSYTSALGNMFDCSASLMASLHNHVPGAVWLLLLVLSGTGCWFTGYRAGTLGRRSKLPLVSLPLLITVVIILVSDLDRPHHGLVHLDESSLRDLQPALGTALDDR